MRERQLLAALSLCCILLIIPAGLSLRLYAQAAPAVGPSSDPVRLIEDAVKSRLGGAVTVVVSVVDPTLPSGEFVTATPDAMGRLGKDVVFTLAPAKPGARSVRVRAHIEVTGRHLEARADILRGHEIGAGNVAEVDGPIVGVAIKRLPDLSQVIGQKALRPIAPRQVVESGFVAIRHAVEPGDKVTVVAAVGPVTVTATMVAADGGDPGDVIRVVNHQTQRSIRVRVVNTALVEVIDVR